MSLQFGQVVPYYLEDKRHAREHAKLSLPEIERAAVTVNGKLNLIHTRQRMQDGKIILRLFEFLHVEYKDPALPVVFLARSETLTLYSSHIQHVELTYALLNGAYLAVFTA